MKHAINNIFYLLLCLFSSTFIACSTTRGTSAPEIDRNFSLLQNRIIELENRNRNLEEELSRLTSQNKFYAEYYSNSIEGVGTNIYTAIESTDNLDKYFNQLLRDSIELERILWEITNREYQTQRENIYTN